MTKSSAYNEGYRAYNEGFNYDENPYDEGSEHKDWFNGYNKAEEESDAKLANERLNEIN